ncbi:hypothetical protein M011DRAFT_469940 [Sporormia fimetaria CBS 119925]|uniref:Uncharacterized protein n=1 Tax=Sporormia fimetaria CBS 119925 TaxID=1340428 RepID=A0A6A6V4C9_9PLEO|nr:hypothetical protein M011DRAFT_469940 [Sporormia fimetaria CBS 119925]
MAIPPPPTLVTQYGMVLYSGRATQRRLPLTTVLLSITSGPDRGRRILKNIVGTEEQLLAALSNLSMVQETGEIPAILLEVAAAVVRDFDAFDKTEDCVDNLSYAFAANLKACARDVEKGDLKRWIRMRKRFDLEQAAAIVISAIRKYGSVEDAARLVREAGTVLTESSMWLQEHDLWEVEGGQSTGVKNLGIRVQRAARWKEQDVPLETELPGLLRLLMKVRRYKTEDRCLHIPEWMFEEAKIEAPSHFREFFRDKKLQPRTPRPGEQPRAAREPDSIIVSKKHFRVLQRRIFRLHRFWDPSARHRRAIKKLEGEVLFADSRFQDRVWNSDHIGLLCHYFFHFQRRLQKKVVSDLHGYNFLKKGEGSTLYQNNIAMKSTFENVLLEIAEAGDSGVIVARGSEDTLDLIDQTCLLMKEYVDIYGDGKTENLVFKKDVLGGSGRGPVNDYNKLCTILSQLREQAKEEEVTGVPGPTYKFLAKDIMHWNDAWEDDAFAGGREPGWKDWIQKRNLLDAWEVMDISDDEGESLPVRVR